MASHGVGWGALTFIELAHILDATQLRSSCAHKHAWYHATCANKHACVFLVKHAWCYGSHGVGCGGDVNVLRTCTHPGCYAIAFFLCTQTCKMQFTKRVGSKRLLTGTQKLDGFWKLLKKFGPSQIRTRDLKDRRICKQVLQQVKSFMWRHNNGVNLWTRLGALARKTSWKKRPSRNHANTSKKFIYVAPRCK